ncbi:MAG TPA: hypothetical protein VNR65_07440 [Geobacterales bacterium]|nr:hypothetical protein [Geobacterales bacterium]
MQSLIAHKKGTIALFVKSFTAKLWQVTTKLSQKFSCAQDLTRLPDSGAFQEFGCRQPENGMMPEGSHIRKGLQNECPFVGVRVRQYDAHTFYGLLHLPVVNNILIAHDVEVKWPGFPPLRIFCFTSPRLCLNPLQDFQKSVSGQRCVSRNNRIQEVGLGVAAISARAVQPGRVLDFDT